MSVHVAGVLGALNVQQRLSRSFFITVLIVIGYLLVYILSKGTLGEGHGGFPESIRFPIQGSIDAFFDFVRDEVAWLTAPFASAVDSILAGFETFFLWIPWGVLLAITGLLAFRLAGLPTAIFALSGLMLIGVWGLWDSTMISLSLMGVSVLFAIAIGVPLGVAAALSNRMDSVLRPILDTMQVLPAFVYFMPALFLFGVGGTVAVSLTIIYALPPAIRLTNLGIRRVPTETIETALSHGSTRLQTLFLVQLPLAKPTIMMGISQTIMMALAMVIMTGLIGSSGLGRDIVTALRTIDSGAGLEAGLAIVFIAIIFDRLCYGLVREGRVTSSTVANGRAGAADVDSKGIGRFPGGVSYLAGLVSLVVLGMLISLVIGTGDFPRVLEYSVAWAVNDAVGWAAVHLFFATDWIKGNLIVEFGLSPARALLEWLPWPLMVAVTAGAAYAVAGRRVAALTVLSWLFLGLSGVWDLAIHTLSQVIVAVAISVIIGFAMGVWASQNRAVEAIVRPILDTMQTLPVFVYLIAVIMLFGSGASAAIIATAVYAIPPIVRMTRLGITLVPEAIVETARSHGASSLQILLQVQIPLAKPTIMMGVNQTIILAFTMVIVGGLVGGGGLGERVIFYAVQLRMGDGFVAGMAIVLMAMVLDRASSGKGPIAQRPDHGNLI